MHAGKRHRAIVRVVRERGSKRATEMAAGLGVPPVTIGEDAEPLAGRGLVPRVHGGPVPPGDRAGTAAPPRARAGGEPVAGMIVPSAAHCCPEVGKGARKAVAAAPATSLLPLDAAFVRLRGVRRSGLTTGAVT
ncbi:DeoR family transcriptional regulator [Streptomyces sp. NPDC001070]